MSFWKKWVISQFDSVRRQLNLNKKEMRTMSASFEDLQAKLTAEHDAVNAKLAELRAAIAALQVGMILTDEQVGALVAIIDDTVSDVATA